MINNPKKLDRSFDVCILMATYNGEAFLKNQLESFLEQEYSNWQLVVSDDGSTDKTLDLLALFQASLADDRIQILDGPRLGFAQNFLSLIRRAPESKYYAFSDQDDVWLPHHLQASINCHQAHQSKLPMITSTRTLLVDEQNRILGNSPTFKRPPGFPNALLQNIGGGNTMLLNGAARDLLARVSIESKVVSHDWLAYMLVTAVGGRFVHLDVPGIRYRQHRSNLIGMNVSLVARFERCTALFRGRLRDWIEQNLIILDQFENEFTPENQQIYRAFKSARLQSNAIRRAISLIESGARRQTLIENWAVCLAAASGRI